MTPLDLFKWKQGIESDADPDLPTTPHLTEYSNDNGLDIDDYTDCTESIMSHYTSAGGSVTKYKKQLAFNQILDQEGELDLDDIGFKTQFDDEGLDTFASTVPLEVLERALLDLDHMRNDFNKGAYIKEEFALHIDLTIQLGRLIDINSSTIHGGGRKLFAVTAPGGWNRAPLCLVNAGYKNLSQPKVDICFALAWDQDKIDQSSPLWEICSKFLDKEELARTVGLLSLDKMKELNAYEEFADACFVPITEIRPLGNYPVSLFEVKKSYAELGVAINQIVNAGVFVCGKQVDLLLATKRWQGKGKFINGSPPFSLGMAITGDHWQIIIVVVATGGYKFSKPRFLYDKIVQGNWVENPKRFIAAVLSMHNTMLEHHVRLLAHCYGLFEQRIASDTENELRPRVSPTAESADTLPPRLIPSTLPDVAEQA